MALTPQHTYQVLTKRPKRMARFSSPTTRLGGKYAVLPNVWLGTSIESRDYAGDADHLREAPAASGSSAPSRC
jgi:protein gp37